MVDKRRRVDRDRDYHIFLPLVGELHRYGHEAIDDIGHEFFSSLFLSYLPFAPVVSVVSVMSHCFLVFVELYSKPYLFVVCVYVNYRLDEARAERRGRERLVFAKFTRVNLVR